MDLIALAAAKKYADKLAAGFKSIELNGTNLVFTLSDGSKTSIAIPAPKDGVSVVDFSIDTDGSLLCLLSDGRTIDAGHVPMADVKLTDYYTKEEINERLNNVVEDIPEVDLTNYYTKEEVDAAIAAAIGAVLDGEY